MKHVRDRIMNDNFFIITYFFMVTHFVKIRKIKENLFCRLFDGRKMS